MPHKCLKDLEAENEALRVENALLKLKQSYYSKLLPVVFVMELTGDGNARSSQLGFWNNELGIALDFSAAQMTIATCDGFEGLIVKSDRYILDDMLAFLVSHKHNSEYNNAIRFKARQDNVVWLYLTSLVFERFADGSPKELLCCGICLDHSLYLQQQFMLWFAEHLPKESKEFLDNLTKREKDIIALIAEGCSQKMIGDMLNMADSTVNTHFKRMYIKTEQHNVGGLIGCLIKNGLHF